MRGFYPVRDMTTIRFGKNGRFSARFTAMQPVPALNLPVRNRNSTDGSGHSGQLIPRIQRIRLPWLAEYTSVGRADYFRGINDLAIG